MLGQRLRVRLAHQVADPFRIDDLVGIEGAVRAAPQRAQDVAQLLADDPLPDELVREVVVDEEVVVEEVAERTVADVVQQSGHPQQFLEQRRRRRVTGEHRAQ